MSPKHRRPSIFSATKAVKANARERLGTPPPVAIIPHGRAKAEYGPPKHKRSMEELLQQAQRGEEV